ncbi:ternary complex factor MIP1 leucine-zipper protein [Actinidia rufa]|uniref:Ternary complex factor MIP1 leucine-zipper protein n=1 Tax=Actinidia rufa TaxID=165716 RepID=A0A7J0GW10_9ERIC|nr:ternary complex factor MIP1 leucine-zipper protein [Actinidia rufa]
MGRVSWGDDQYKLILSVMDKDTFSADDFLGQAIIYLEDLLALGVEKGSAELHPSKYKLVSCDQSYCGEIQVGVTFTPKPSDSEKQRRVDLEEEVEKLQEDLDAELKKSKILQCALQGPVHSCPCLSKLLPSEVQGLLAELATVEEEIIWLERKVDELKLSLYQEKKLTRDWELPKVNRRHWQKKQQSYGQHDFKEHGNNKNLQERRASFGSSMDVQSLSSMKFSVTTEDLVETSRRTRRSQNRSHLDTQIGVEKPNKLSEELMTCLIGIFLKLNQVSLAGKGSAVVPKHSLSCVNSKGFLSKNTFNCKAPAFSFDNTSNIDPYGILPDFDVPIRDVGPYKNFIQITRSSLDISQVSECFQEMGNLRVLMHKLCNVDLNSLTYKQKLAFWINIYNACIMHAFLLHGLPSTEEKLLALMNKAAMNVGGIVLNALAIEHFILRHPSDSKHGSTDEKEMLLRHAYGLGYPEPNVTFALCRGSWSSPALRVYTPENVVNEMGRAKVEYLEASVGVTSKKKIVVPKLLQWHMRDFADDLESLLEWIYSQLPHSCSLKRLIMACLIGETKSPFARMVEIQPYDSEFRYLLPL